MTVHTERLVSVEVEVRELKKAFDEHKVKTDRDLDAINDKLDDLLQLRYKGAGAFWLASTLVGTGIIGLFFQLMDWFKGN